MILCATCGHRLNANKSGDSLLVDPCPNCILDAKLQTVQEAKVVALNAIGKACSLSHEEMIQETLDRR